MERAIRGDPSETKNPMTRPAKVIVGETFAGLKKFPASGLFITKASPILPRPIVIPTVTRTIPRIRKKTGAASSLGGVVKERNRTLLERLSWPGLSQSEPLWRLADQYTPRQSALHGVHKQIKADQS